MTLQQLAEKAIEIFDAADYAAEMDAGFDAGEFSGGYHFQHAECEVAVMAKRFGHTLDDVINEMNAQWAADQGPYGVIV